jgi:uncharacterized protein DUF5658
LQPGAQDGTPITSRAAQGACFLRLRKPSALEVTVPESISHSKTPAGGIWYTIFRLSLPLQRESALFLIVNVLDVMMTYLMLSDIPEPYGRTMFYESNPVARWFLVRWHLPGIVVFKFTMVAVVEVIAQIVALRQLQLGRRLLEFGTLVVAVVVLYSMYLLLWH